MNRFLISLLISCSFIGAQEIPSLYSHLPMTIGYTLLGDVDSQETCPGCQVSDFNVTEGQLNTDLSLTGPTSLTLPAYNFTFGDLLIITRFHNITVEPFGGKCVLEDGPNSDCVPENHCFVLIVYQMINSLRK